MRLKLTLLFSLILVLYSCRRIDEGALAQLNHAQDIMEEHYDSALVILNGIRDAEHKFTEADYMRYLMSRVEAANKAYLPIDTFSYMPRVVEYYQHHGTPYQKTNSLYLMGSIFRDRGDAPRAISFFKQAVAVEYPEYTKMDYLKIGDAYDQMATLYSHLMYDRLALKMLDKRIEYALKSGDTLIAIQSYDYKSDEYVNLGMPDSALIISKRTYKMFKDRGENSNAAAILPTQIIYYINCDSLEKAKEAIDEYIAYSGLVNSKKREVVYSRKSGFYNKLGNYYYKIHKNDSALHFFRLLLQNNINENYQKACKGLMKVYKEIGEPDSVYKYAMLYGHAMDSLRLENGKNEITRVAALYDYNESERKALEKAREAESLRTTFYIVICIFIIAGLLAYIYVKRQRERKRAELVSINQKYSETLNLYLRAEEEMKSLKQDAGSQISRKAEEVKRLRKVLSSYQENVNTDVWNEEQSLMHHDVVVQMHGDAAHARTATESQWKDLEAVISKFVPDFSKMLNDKRCELTDNEFRICMLSRLNFIPSEMSTLLDLSRQRVSNMRAVINMKLFGETGSKTLDKNLKKQ